MFFCFVHFFMKTLDVKSVFQRMKIKSNPAQMTSSRQNKLSQRHQGPLVLQFIYHFCQNSQAPEKSLFKWSRSVQSKLENQSSSKRASLILCNCHCTWRPILWFKFWEHLSLMSTHCGPKRAAGQIPHIFYSAELLVWTLWLMIWCLTFHYPSYQMPLNIIQSIVQAAGVMGQAHRGKTKTRGLHHRTVKSLFIYFTASL